MPACTAPVDDFGAAIVAVAAQQDLCLWPMAVDCAHQAAQESPDFCALGPLGRAQYGGDEAALVIEHDNGLEAVFVMMGIEQAQLLAAVDSVEGVINVEHNALGHCGKLSQYRSTIARPMRNNARVSGRFSRREMVGCEHSARVPEGVRSSAILNIGSTRRLDASLPSS